MELLQPFMLWGASAVAIPVILHFWHQKKGKTLDWAAMRWLQEKDQQQQRGFQFDNPWLLALRCLLLVLLAVLLSQPVFRWLRPSPAVQKIHLVQPEKIVVDNFRFELEEATRRGEAVYWIDGSTELVKKTDGWPDQPLFSPALLQSVINRLQKENTELNLYLVNDSRLANAPFIRVPDTYQLHLVPDSVSQPLRNYLAFSDGKKTFVNLSNRLITGQDLDPAARFLSAPIHTDSLTVLVRFNDKIEQQTVSAALDALSEVYSLDIQQEQRENPAKKYDWILTDTDVVTPKPETFYVISGTPKVQTVSNVIYVGETFSPQRTERVRNGQLPEWLGELLIAYFRMKPEKTELSPEQLKTVFVATARPDRQQPEADRNWVLIALVVVTGVERWVALKKNA
ncbi:BatA domain-containing protein [Larkinella bovis]|uniref:BatA domain-containing protein n=1 Tax=Larkinella bovis TaxID=683041 RepID=A0ABW0IH55_9BACT